MVAETKGWLGMTPRARAHGENERGSCCETNVIETAKCSPTGRTSKVPQERRGPERLRNLITEHWQDRAHNWGALRILIRQRHIGCSDSKISS